MGVSERRKQRQWFSRQPQRAAEQQQRLFFFWGAGGAFVISKRIERTLPLLLAAQQRNRALLENVSVIYLCTCMYFIRSDKAYAFFHFCTLSFARDTPILLRDTDFDVFFRVTARWVK